MKINRKQIIKKVLYCLALSSMMMETSCSINNSNETEEVIGDSTLDSNSVIDNEIKKLIEEIIIEEEIPKVDEVEVEQPKETIKPEPIYYDEDSIENYSRIIHTVITDEKVTIRKENNDDSEKMGIYPANRDFELLSNQDSEWYEIDYYGKVGYISKHKSHETIKRIMDAPIIKKGYLTNDSILYTNKSMRIEKAELNKLEFVEIYKELDNCYMVATNDDIGFIPKENVELVSGTMAVADLSNQEIKLYKENEDPTTGDEVLIITAPMVSGTKDTERATAKGFFTVWHKYKKPRYIVPGAWVENGIFFDKNNGIHDSSTWRKDWEFGGITYYRNGSHGCFNLSLDDSIVFNDNLELGDKVLVKE